MSGTQNLKHVFGLNQSMIPVSGDQKFYQMCSGICLPSFYLENALLWYQIYVRMISDGI